MGTRAVHGLGAPRSVVVVASPDGTPHAVVVGGRRRAVVEIREDWLIQDRWWTSEPIDRHYFDLLVEPGRVMVVFRDPHGGWFGH